MSGQTSKCSNYSIWLSKSQIQKFIRPFASETRTIFQVIGACTFRPRPKKKQSWKIAIFAQPSRSHISIVLTKKRWIKRKYWLDLNRTIDTVLMIRINSAWDWTISWNIIPFLSANSKSFRTETKHVVLFWRFSQKKNPELFGFFFKCDATNAYVCPLSIRTKNQICSQSVTWHLNFKRRIYYLLNFPKSLQ